MRVSLLSLSPCTVKLAMVQKNRKNFEAYTGGYDKESRDFFPEFVHRMYCVNCPWYVRFGWTMMKKVYGRTREHGLNADGTWTEHNLGHSRWT